MGRPPAGATPLRLMFDPDASFALDTLPGPGPAGAVELLIGAEGGLSPEETELALRAGFNGVRMGHRVLRTETAGLAALAVMQCLWGDFRGDAGDVRIG